MGGQPADYENVRLTGQLSRDLSMVRRIFLRDSILRIRPLYCVAIGQKCAAVYFDGMVNSDLLVEGIFRPMTQSAPIHCPHGNRAGDTDAAVALLAERVLAADDVKVVQTLGEMLRAVMYGDTLLLVDGSTSALMVNSKGWKTRGIDEPEDERVLEGPREGFNESAMISTALLRRKLQTPDFSVELLRVGRRTDTKVYLCYLGSLAPRRLVKALRQRIASIDIDGILDVNYLSELMSDRPRQLFRTSGTTERPDVVAARLLEGRIAILCDGSPMALTVPYLFSENFQSDEDYYQPAPVACVGRFLRYLSFFLSISVPAVYVALTVFHRRLLPTAFLLSVSAARQGVPIASVTECLLLILIFEILKEAGLRTSQSLGNALSIVGGLVVGQAAVEAKFVSAPMLIIVALSGIAGLMVPRLRAPVFYLRLLLVIAAATLGLFGYMAVMAAVIVRILSLRSYGFDETPALSSPSYQSFKDTILRAPIGKMRLRPPLTGNRIRLKMQKGRRAERDRGV